MSSRDRNHSKHSSSKASFKGCFCCLFLFVILILLIIIAACLVIVLVLKPEKPQIDLRQVTVQIVGLSPIAAVDVASSADVAADVATAAAASSTPIRITMVFSVKNDNKLGIKFTETKFIVMYNRIPLGDGSVPEFFMSAHCTRRVITVIVVNRSSLLQIDGGALLRDAAISDQIALRVTGIPGAKIVLVGISSPEVQVAVDCSITISPRKQAVINQSCSFDGVGV